MGNASYAFLFGLCSRVRLVPDSSHSVFFDPVTRLQQIHKSAWESSWLLPGSSDLVHRSHCSLELHATKAGIRGRLYVFFSYVHIIIHNVDNARYTHRAGRRQRIQLQAGTVIAGGANSEKPLKSIDTGKSKNRMRFFTTPNGKAAFHSATWLRPRSQERRL